MSILKISGEEFMRDKVLKESAALAFFTVFSLPAALIVFISISGIVFGEDAVTGKLFYQIKDFVGPVVALQIQDILKNVHLDYDNFWMAVFGVGVLLFSATGIFTEIQDSINHIWGLKVRPEKSWLKFIKNRVVSFSMIIVLGFILMVSLIVNAGMNIFIDWLSEWLPEFTVKFLFMFDQVLIFGVITFLFATIIKVLPDAHVRWSDVFMGSVVSAVLFLGGKFAIGYYLTNSASISAYGAASSVIILLFWVYYTAIVLYFGAELTQTYVRFTGRRIKPTRYAYWVEEIEVEKESNI